VAPVEPVAPVAPVAPVDPVAPVEPFEENETVTGVFKGNVFTEEVIYVTLSKE
jgi:hypothetical protein